MSTKKLGQKKATRKEKARSAKAAAASEGLAPAHGKSTAKKPSRTILNPTKALKVKAPDVGKKERLATDLGKLIGLHASKKIGDRPLSVLESKTAEQKAIELASDWYAELVKDDKFASAVATMIGLRRVYAVCYRELQEQADRVGGELAAKDRGDMPDTVVDFAVQYAAWQASKAFDEHQVMQGMADTILPWMADVIDRHTEADEKDNAAAREEAAEARKATTVPVGLVHTPQQESADLARDATLVLVGWRPAVLWLLDKACEAVLAAPGGHTVLRLMDRAPKPGEQDARLIRLGQNAWAGCAESDRKVDMMVAKYVQNVVGSPIDLVVLDDLAKAHQSGFVGRQPAAAAGDAQRRLRRWCNGMGAAIVAALPRDDMGDPDQSGLEYEQLRTFTLLRAVTVKDSPDQADHYRLTVGTNASVFDVPKSTLDAYGRTTLVVPGGV